MSTLEEYRLRAEGEQRAGALLDVLDIMTQAQTDGALPMAAGSLAKTLFERGRDFQAAKYALYSLACSEVIVLSFDGQADVGPHFEPLVPEPREI